MKRASMGKNAAKISGLQLPTNLVCSCDNYVIRAAVAEEDAKIRVEVTFCWEMQGTGMRMGMETATSVWYPEKIADYEALVEELARYCVAHQPYYRQDEDSAASQLKASFRINERRWPNQK